jgi:hypothetical protein
MRIPTAARVTAFDRYVRVELACQVITRDDYAGQPGIAVGRPRRKTCMGYAPKIVLQLPLSNPDLLDDFVEACIRDGVVLIAIVGEGASKVDDMIDELVVGDASDSSRFITTSFHPDETLDEVIEFARMWERDLGQPVELVKL